MPITISPLSGPEIFWISTLCEGDTTKYWTTAEDCIYTWTAEDSDGNNVLLPGTDITNDTLCVVWGDGPFGTVSLAVSGCSDGPYCTDPTSVIIPIIESETEIMGKDTVCTFASEFYDVHKWPTATYVWSIDPNSAGFIVSGQGTNAVNIQWNVGPQYATVNVSYGSEFLGGILGHNPEDCQGMGSFDVHILPEFELKQPTESKFCLDENFTLEAGDVNFTNIDPINGWTWEIRPTVGTTIVSTGNMTPYTTSLSTAGIYTIAGYPDYPNPYCNDTVFTVIEIIEDSFWGKLTQKDRELVDWMADQVVKRNLSVLAVLTLESYKPLSFIGSQMLHVFNPMLNAFFSGEDNFDRVAFLMEDRQNVERLLQRIELKQDEANSKKENKEKK
jgi:hypothetical protein